MIRLYHTAWLPTSAASLQIKLERSDRVQTSVMPNHAC